LQIVGYHLSRDNSTIYTSKGEQCSQPPYVEFLLKEKDAIRVCYQLDFFVANLFVLCKLTRKQLIQLYETTELRIGDYKFKFVPKKFLSIIKGDQFVLFSDASQYMERYDLVGDTAEKAVEARKIGVQVYNTLSKLGLHPKSIISPIATFEKEVLVKMDIPTIDDMPEEAAQYAYECCTGPIVQAYRIGRFEKCYDWDIKSAYASNLMNCIDFREQYGTWKKIDHFDPASHYGYYKGIVNMKDCFHPIVYENNTPKGEWERKSLKEELEFITKYDRGTWEVEDGWVFYPTKFVYPYKKIILWLNDWKDKTKGMERKVVKRILESLWGYTLRIDFNGEIAIPSEYMNTVFGAQTETLTKLAVGKFIIENGLEESLISIAVDGVLVDKEITL